MCDTTVKITFPEEFVRSLAKGNIENTQKFLDILAGKEPKKNLGFLFTLKALYSQLKDDTEALKNISILLEKSVQITQESPFRYAGIDGYLLALTALYDCSNLSKYTVALLKNNKEINLTFLETILHMRFVIRVLTDDINK